MRDFLITNKAFEPPPLVEVPRPLLNLYLQALYGDLVEPCYDFDNLVYQPQMEILVENFYLLAGDYEDLDPELVWQVKENFSNLQYPSGTREQRKRYFREIKENLEEILYLIKDWEPAKRAHYIMNLGEQIADCGPGAYTQIANALYDLKSQDTLPFWLANLRRNDLQILGEQHVAKKEITDIYSMHVHVAFGKFSDAEGWGIPPATMLAGLSDQYEEDAKVEDQDLQELRFKFERGLRPDTLVDATYTNVHALLHAFRFLDLSHPDRLGNFKRLIQPFLLHRIFDLNVLSCDENSNRTRLQPSFWRQLHWYCEQLLVREGIILGAGQMQEERGKAVRAFMNKHQPAEKLIPNLARLGYFLFWLPLPRARALLEELDPAYLKSLVHDRYELLSLLYQLPLEVGAQLIGRLGRTKLQGLFTGSTVFLLEVLMGNRHPISQVLQACLPRETWQDQASIMVYQQVLSVLAKEKERLQDKYGRRPCPRVAALDETIFKILRGLDEAGEGGVTRQTSYTLKNRIRWAIQENLMNDSLDKYKTWGRKLGLALLNVLLTLPIITLPVKRLVTGTWFFSLKGKTHEAGERAVHNLNRMTAF